MGAETPSPPPFTAPPPPPRCCNCRHHNSAPLETLLAPLYSFSAKVTKLLLIFSSICLLFLTLSLLPTCLLRSSPSSWATSSTPSSPWLTPSLPEDSLSGPFTRCLSEEDLSLTPSSGQEGSQQEIGIDHTLNKLS